MKVLVTYYSETGNTEKIAQAVNEGIQKAQKEILPVNEVKDLAKVERLIRKLDNSTEAESQYS